MSHPTWFSRTRLAALPCLATLTCLAATACAHSAAPAPAPLPSITSTAGARIAAHPTGTVHEDQLFSPALGATKHVVIYLPPSYAHEPERRFPVAYYLHGLSGSETDWTSKGSIDVAADSLTAAGAPEMIIVMPDGDDGWYTTWSEQFDYRTCADTLHTESADRFCVQHQRYDDYIAHDVVSYVDTHYRTRADRAHRGIGGLSMGGYGAVALALRFPTLFSAAASHSGVLSVLYTGPHPFAEPARYGASPADVRSAAGGFFGRYEHFWGADIERWRANDPAHLAEQLVRTGGPQPALYIDCGRDDGFVDQNRAFDAELTRLGISHRYAEWPGAHTWRYWSTHVRESLAWMSGEIGR